jgi:hypothetical protein
MIGPQLTAGADDSSGASVTTVEEVKDIADPLVPEQQDDQDQRDRNAQKPQQDTSTHHNLPSARLTYRLLETASCAGPHKTVNGADCS